MIYPKFIKKGDTLGIVALSAGVGKKLPSFEKSIEKLHDVGFKTVETNSVRVNNVRANTGEKRAIEFNHLVKRDDIDMVICASGGDFQFETLPYIDYELIQSNPKWCMGYSDPTNLLYTVTTKLDIATLYGCNAGSYDIEHEYLDTNLQMIQGNIVSQNSYQSYQLTKDFLDDNNVYNGKVEWITSSDLNVTGRCIGGCIDVLKDLIGTIYDGTLDFIERYKEDGNIFYFDNFAMSAENFYRTLLQMKYACYFKYTKAIIVGRVCFESNETGMTYIEALGKLNIPYVMNADIGHVAPKMTMINGALMTLKTKGTQGTIEFELK